MADKTRTVADRQSEILDVQLLDVFAEVEALLRYGREVQREALKVRGVPEPLSGPQRQAAARAILAHLRQMVDGCRMLAEVLHDLQGTAGELDSLLAQDTSS